MMAKVGENHRGQFIINDFRYNGVDTSATIVDAPGTSSPFCLSLSEEEHKTRIFIGKEAPQENCCRRKSIMNIWAKQNTFIWKRQTRPARRQLFLPGSTAL